MSANEEPSESKNFSESETMLASIVFRKLITAIADYAYDENSSILESFEFVYKNQNEFQLHKDDLPLVLENSEKLVNRYYDLDQNFIRLMRHSILTEMEENVGFIGPDISYLVQQFNSERNRDLFRFLNERITEFDQNDPYHLLISTIIFEEIWEPLDANLE